MSTAKPPPPPQTKSVLLLLLLFSFFLLINLPKISAAAAAIDDAELGILLSLKSALQKSNPDAFSSWQSTSAKCNFAGIRCDSFGAVTEIDLSSRRLVGVPPIARMCELPNLQKLSLGFNSLHGTIPEELNNCHRLQYLDLGNNLFSGAVPPISSLSNLRVLYLNNSGFSAAFPWKSLANMTAALEVLSLGDNPLDRSPLPAELARLTRLSWLYLTNCSIEGQIPLGFGNLVSLKNLELSNNHLSGEIPPDFVKLQNLWQLELYDNNLTGKLPVGFGNLTNLQYFDASRNNLEGDLSELRFLTNLISLQLYENRFAGKVPEEFGEFRRLVNLSLYANNLTGPLPRQLGSWADFNFIDVTDNSLTGLIPPDMCRRGTMQRLLMLDNRFSGEIPATYAACSTLIRFRVNGNSLSGVVPAGIWGLPAAEIIDFRWNNLEGPITADIARAKTLAQLYVSSNRFSGVLPPEISEASRLLVIDLRNNRFSGEIPDSIGEMRNLATLDLQDNAFTGEIPKSLGSCKSLTEVNIADNSLSGEIPSALGSLPNLNSLNLSGNQLSGKIPTSLSSVGLSLLDLSNNKLTGPIPPSLSIEAYNGSFAGNAGLCSAAVSNFRRCASRSGVSKEYRALIACFAVTLTILLLMLAIFVRSKRRREAAERSASRGKDLRKESWDLKSFQVLTFTEGDILDAIKEDNLIGKGGSGDVYRVTLPSGVNLAVKHISTAPDGGGRRSSRSNRSSTPMLAAGAKRGGRSRSRELEAEVEALSSIRHVNVVKLYCSITSEESSLLVYEYMPNGSLWDRLHTCGKGRAELDWEARHEIAVGAAKGLEYLHHGCERPMIHRDVKSSNILLDEFLKPRIADFGLAKIVKAHAAKDSTRVIAGTPGYFAPEYGYTYKVNEKSDVYSFGVVLMELVTGKRPIEPAFGESRDIVSWVYSELKSRESVLSIVDPAIFPEALKEEALKVLRISILCTARLPEHRPTMRVVVKMLEEAEPSPLVDIIVDKDDGVTKDSQEVRHFRAI